MAKRNKVSTLAWLLIAMVIVIYGYSAWAVWDSAEPLNSLSTLATIIGISVLGGLIIGLVVFWFVMILDAIGNKKLSGFEKLLWVVAFFLFGPLLAILYYYVASSHRKK